MEKARVDCNCNRKERVIIYLITIGMIYWHMRSDTFEHINIMSDPSLLSDSFAFAV